MHELNPVSRFNEPGRSMFLLLLAYFFIEYIRPQDLVSVFRPLKLGLLCSLTLAGYWFLHGRKADFREPLIFGMFLFLCLGAFSVVFAANEYRVYITAKALVLYLFAACLPIISLLNTMERVRQFFHFFVFINVFVAIYALRSGGVGTGSFLVDENDMALAALITLPFAYYLGNLPGISRRRKMALLGSAVILTAAIVVSGSRGGFVGFVAVTGGIIWFSKSRLRIIVALTLAGGVGLMFVPASYWAEMQTISDTEDSTASQRLWSWSMAIEMYKEHPVLGVGFGNYPANVASYELRSPDFDPFTMRLHGGRVAHSLYFTILPEMGTLGSILYFSLVWMLLRKLLRLLQLSQDHGDGDTDPDILFIDALTRALLVALGAFMTCGLFLTICYYPHFWYLMAFSIAAERQLQALREAAV